MTGGQWDDYTYGPQLFSAETIVIFLSNVHHAAAPGTGVVSKRLIISCGYQDKNVYFLKGRVKKKCDILLKAWIQTRLSVTENAPTYQLMKKAPEAAAQNAEMDNVLLKERTQAIAAAAAKTAEMDKALQRKRAEYKAAAIQAEKEAQVLEEAIRDMKDKTAAEQAHDTALALKIVQNKAAAAELKKKKIRSQAAASATNHDLQVTADLLLTPGAPLTDPTAPTVSTAPATPMAEALVMPVMPAIMPAIMPAAYELTENNVRINQLEDQVNALKAQLKEYQQMVGTLMMEREQNKRSHASFSCSDTSSDNSSSCSSSYIPHHRNIFDTHPVASLDPPMMRTSSSVFNPPQDETYEQNKELSRFTSSSLFNETQDETYNQNEVKRRKTSTEAPVFDGALTPFSKQLNSICQGQEFSSGSLFYPATNETIDEERPIYEV